MMKNMSTKTINAVIYTRVSTQVQADKGFGLDAQLEKCRNMCKLKDFNIIKEYSDKAVSGTTEVRDRPGFGELLENLKDINVIVIYCFDRLARDTRILLQLVEDLEKTHNVSVSSCKEDVDTNTINGKFFLTVFGAVSALELSTITARLQMGKQQKRLLSGYVGGHLPYGYVIKDKIIKVHEDHSKIVRKIHNLYSFCGKRSMNKIARLLNHGGIPSPRGKQWSGKTIKVILEHRNKYEGGIINNNENDVRWPKIIEM